jgi:hypothetical protein
LFSPEASILAPITSFGSSPLDGLEWSRNSERRELAELPRRSSANVIGMNGANTRVLFSSGSPRGSRCLVQAHEDGLIGNRKRYEVSVET